MNSVDPELRNSFHSLKVHWKSELSAGFSVSLIALPLCLGIAIASGFPPLAGLLTAIVGGIFASRISGSYVTISGPAAGLIVISLAAAENLGGAGAVNGYAGYPHALAAIVIGGALVALLGFLKVGKLGDVFPPAVVHGMLAAIGVIIMIKQFFPALGISSPEGNLIQVFLQIPSSITSLNPLVSLIALLSLMVFIVHPHLQLKWVQLIPAPMWVLIISIPLAWVFKIHDGNEYYFLGQSYHLGPELLVKLPDDIFGSEGIRFPDFSKIAESAFWIAVISIALVSAVESLLSAKAVDALDPYERKSDLDKDLVAMGSGSTASGLIGGLSMISEIVRSSANISNGAKTQWANFFHGCFLLVYVLLAKPLIELIPLSALAAMLVFTGFRLASPKEFKHMKDIGWQELLIFLVTLLGVIFTDLIIGVILGMAFKYAIMLFRGVSPRDLFTVWAKVGKENDTLHIQLITTALIFSNYLYFKKLFEDDSQSFKKIEVDFRNVRLIDHTTMSHLKELKHDYELEGVKVEWLNMEGMKADSTHELAQRVRVKPN